MPITTSCPQCRSLFRLPENLAGKQVSCQKCRQIFAVPLSATDGAEMVAPSFAVADAPPDSLFAVEAQETPLPPPAADEEIIEASLAESSETTVPAPIAPVPQPARPRMPLPPEPVPSVMWTVAALVLLLLGLLGTGSFASYWVFAHLTLPAMSVSMKDHVQLANQDRRFEEKKKENFIVPKRVVPQPLVPTPLPVDFQGKAFVKGRLDWPQAGIDPGRFGNAGAFGLFQAKLEQGKRYKFVVEGIEFLPRVRLFDGEALLANQKGDFQDRVVLIYEAKRTGNHQIFVTSEDAPFGNFKLSFSPESPRSPTKRLQTIIAAFDGGDRYEDRRNLTESDPDEPNAIKRGPYKSYLVPMEAGKHYAIDLHSKEFKTRLALYAPDGELLASREAPKLGQTTTRIEHLCLQDGLYRVHAVSLLPKKTGAYKLSITGQAVAK